MTGDGINDTPLASLARRSVFDPPSRLWLALEARAGLELASSAALWPLLLRGVPPGDGHPVLVLPGWLGGDLSTRLVRRFLARLDYRAQGWGLGLNLGPTPELVRCLAERLHSIAERAGRRVSLVGWSLGGGYAHELARRYPERVRSLATLASPLRTGAGRWVASSFDEVLGPAEVEHGPATPAPPPVPMTALFSRSDGIVPWRACLARPSCRSESIEVPTSHCGMGLHPGTLWVLADRLAQREGEWRPFEPTGLATRLLGIRNGPPRLRLPPRDQNGHPQHEIGARRLTRTTGPFRGL